MRGAAREAYREPYSTRTHCYAYMRPLEGTRSRMTFPGLLITIITHCRAGGGEGISDLAAPLTDPAPATAPQATAPQATAPQATAPAATVAPHKAQSAPEPADVRATALKAEAQVSTSCRPPLVAPDKGERKGHRNRTVNQYLTVNCF